MPLQASWHCLLYSSRLLAYRIFRSKTYWYNFLNSSSWAASTTYWLYLAKFFSVISSRSSLSYLSMNSLICTVYCNFSKSMTLWLSCGILQKKVTASSGFSSLTESFTVFWETALSSLPRYTSNDSSISSSLKSFSSFLNICYSYFIFVSSVNSSLRERILMYIW